MPYLSPSVLDNGLSHITSQASHLYLLSAAPASWTNWAQVEALIIGYKVAPTVAAPSDRTPSGRRVVVSAITDGVVDPGGGSSSGELWALVDETGEEVLAANDVTNDQVLVNGNVFTLTQFEIGIPGV